MGKARDKKTREKRGAPTREFKVTELRKLIDWFERRSRVLPWREDPSLYRVWISEIMLQQTQVITVLPYFERFMRAFPTLKDLANAPLDRVLEQWAGLGYYARARNLHRGAQFIFQRVQSQHGFPKTQAEWLEVPGVGPYTAGAITSIALDLPEPIVDGNVERVFSRLRRISRDEKSYKDQLWNLSRQAVHLASKKELSPSKLNQAWMELGALVCTPKSPKCGVCPLVRTCWAHQEEQVMSYPSPKPRKKWIEVQERRVACIQFDEETVLLERAQSGEWREGLWDFPSRKPPGMPKSKKLAKIETQHVVTRHRISRTLEIERTREMTSLDPQRYRWVSLHDPKIALGSAPKKGLQKIRERFFSESFPRSSRP